jgi:hypothetical protein
MQNARDAIDLQLQFQLVPHQCALRQCSAAVPPAPASGPTACRHFRTAAETVGSSDGDRTNSMSESVCAGSRVAKDMVFMPSDGVSASRATHAGLGGLGRTTLVSLSDLQCSLQKEKKWPR